MPESRPKAAAGQRTMRSADGEEQERRGGEEADGHGEVALAALGEAVAAVDEDEEGGGEEGGRAIRCLTPLMTVMLS